MSTKFNSIPSKVLASSITAASTTFRLKDILGWDGLPLTAADFGTQAWAVFVNANRTVIEIMEFDPATIASTNITINKRGMKFLGDLTTEVPANKLDWTKDDTFVQLGTDTPQSFQWLKEYIDGIAIAGSPNASTTAKGIVEAATLAEVRARTAIGGTGAVLVATPDVLTDLPSQTEKDALAGGDTFGTPSTSNKFVTETFLTNRVPTTQTFNISGTYTKPAGLVWARLQMWGGGASGARAVTTDEAGGGGGGGYFEKILLASEITGPVTVTVGAGGGAVGSPGSGIAGGNTTWGTQFTAFGGGAGAQGGSGGGGGGGGSYFSEGGNASGSTQGTNGSPNGNTYLGGGQGGFGDIVPLAGGSSTYGGGGGGAVSAGASAAGGTSVFGGNGGAAQFGATGNATSGSAPGGGGGAKHGTAGSSGAGAAGRIVVTEYYL